MAIPADYAADEQYGRLPGGTGAIEELVALIYVTDACASSFRAATGCP